MRKEPAMTSSYASNRVIYVPGTSPTSDLRPLRMRSKLRPAGSGAGFRAQWRPHRGVVTGRPSVATVAADTESGALSVKAGNASQLLVT